LEEWALPTFVKEEYEVYTAIEEQEFENQEKKEYLLKLMQEGKRPKEVDAGII
jgi:hypothetical protein